ncbi:unnamed protein product, partial [Ceratitis capitata]
IFDNWPSIRFQDHKLYSHSCLASSYSETQATKPLTVKILEDIVLDRYFRESKYKD